MHTIISRADAAAQGLKHFFTGKVCVHGHLALRYVNSRVCVECNRTNGRKWYERHPATAAAKRAADKQKNPDRYRLHYRRNAEKRKEQAIGWYYANKEHALRVCQDWRERNPDKCRDMGRLSTRKRRARKQSVGGTHTQADLDRIYQQQRGKCAVCKCSLAKVRKEVDHIIALARGGHNNASNLQYLCRACNRAKSAKDPIQFAQERGLLL